MICLTGALRGTVKERKSSTPEENRSKCSDTNYYQRLLALARTITNGREGIKLIT